MLTHGVIPLGAHSFLVRNGLERLNRTITFYILQKRSTVDKLVIVVTKRRRSLVSGVLSLIAAAPRNVLLAPKSPGRPGGGRPDPASPPITPAEHNTDMLVYSAIASGQKAVGFRWATVLQREQVVLHTSAYGDESFNWVWLQLVRVPVTALPQPPRASSRRFAAKHACRLYTASLSSFVMFRPFVPPSLSIAAHFCG